MDSPSPDVVPLTRLRPPRKQSPFPQGLMRMGRLTTPVQRNKLFHDIRVIPLTPPPILYLGGGELYVIRVFPLRLNWGWDGFDYLTVPATVHKTPLFFSYPPPCCTPGPNILRAFCRFPPSPVALLQATSPRFPWQPLLSFTPGDGMS